MTPEQKMLVRTSFAQVVPIAEPAAAMFYARLFELDPSLRRLFHGDMQEQGRKLMDMLRVAVASLDRLDNVLPALERLGARHAGYGVQPSHYATVGAALLWTLEQGLGSAFTPDVRAAWTVLYTLVADVMQGAQAEAAATMTRARAA
jgi:hemoglobin-like flavoprotein